MLKKISRLKFDSLYKTDIDITTNDEFKSHTKYPIGTVVDYNGTIYIRTEATGQLSDWKVAGGGLPLTGGTISGSIEFTPDQEGISLNDGYMYINADKTIGFYYRKDELDGNSLYIYNDNGVTLRLDDDGNFGIDGLPTYVDNAAAVTGGLKLNDFYKTASGELRIRI